MLFLRVEATAAHTSTGTRTHMSYEKGEEEEERDSQ
jgi:hypothetical protein